MSGPLDDAAASRAVPDATPVIVGVGQHCPKDPDLSNAGGPVDLAAAAEAAREP